MTQVWKVAGMWLVIAAVIWLFSIWQWQTTDATVADRDIVMQLLVLPVMLTAALWLSLRGVQRLRTSSAQAAAPGAAPAVSLDEQPNSEAALRAANTWLLASGVSLRAGSDADAAWGIAAILASMGRKNLKQVQGMPQTADGNPGGGVEVASAFRVVKPNTFTMGKSHWLPGIGRHERAGHRG